MLSKETIWSILSTHILAESKIYQDDRPQCDPSELVEHIVIELALMRDIERELRLLSEERQMLAEEHVKALDEIDFSMNEAIGRCPHHSTTTHDNLSAVCDTCGKEL
jgi:hypothetical protein